MIYGRTPYKEKKKYAELISRDYAQFICKKMRFGGIASIILTKMTDPLP